MINLMYKINENPTPPAAPPNFSFMSSIQIVPDLSNYVLGWALDSYKVNLY